MELNRNSNDDAVDSLSLSESSLASGAMMPSGICIQAEEGIVRLLHKEGEMSLAEITSSLKMPFPIIEIAAKNLFERGVSSTTTQAVTGLEIVSLTPRKNGFARFLGIL